MTALTGVQSLALATRRPPSRSRTRGGTSRGSVPPSSMGTGRSQRAKITGQARNCSRRMQLRVRTARVVVAVAAAPPPQGTESRSRSAAPLTRGAASSSAAPYQSDQMTALPSPLRTKDLVRSRSSGGGGGGGGDGAAVPGIPSPPCSSSCPSSAPAPPALWASRSLTPQRAPEVTTWVGSW